MGTHSDKQNERLLLEGFMARLQTPPNQDEVRTNQHAGNSLYLPISFVEMTLDELFFGLWETKDFKWQVIANEIVGSISLRVFHPTAGIWIERTGASATMIRQTKGAQLTDVGAKIHNALEMDLPHLKADCIANAAKSLGKAFGRDLNRKFSDVWRPIVTGRAVQSGAITAQVEHDSKMAAALLVLDENIEQARMDDQTLLSIEEARANCETPQQVYILLDTVRQYIPESIDPAKQFNQRLKT